jgi:hypothetical protein
MEAFDPVSGALIGALTWSDVVRPGCITPIGETIVDSNAAAGRDFYYPARNTCPTLKLCALRADGDGGFGSPRRCDIDAILTGVGIDAGTCPEGLVRASVCTQCLSGCNRRNLVCAAPCTATQDCRTAGVSGTCVDSICQDFCPF